MSEPGKRKNALVFGRFNREKYKEKRFVSIRKSNLSVIGKHNKYHLAEIRVVNYFKVADSRQELSTSFWSKKISKIKIPKKESHCWFILQAST